jgi:flagellar assembly factor FliW
MTTIDVATRFLGIQQCAHESVVTFPLGIPPFFDQQSFVVIPKQNSPFLFLQSVQKSDLCFIVLPLQIVDPEYRVCIEPEDAETLRLDAGTQQGLRDLVGLVILTIPEEGPMLANLAAPVLINTAKKIGVQAVRTDLTYSHAHPLALAARD